MKRFINKTRGFTLIELLIVIALIGILAVALLSAINPLEQLRKGRDSARKADAAELLNAVERFYTSYQCYPWDYTGGACVTVGSYDVTMVTVPANPVFTAGGNGDDLITVNELKSEFQARLENVSNPSYNKLWITTPGGTANIEGKVRICFEPESTTGRTGGLGTLTSDITADPLGAAVSPCPDYAGGTTYAASNCYICVPQ